MHTNCGCDIYVPLLINFYLYFKKSCLLSIALAEAQICITTLYIFNILMYYNIFCNVTLFMMYVIVILLFIVCAVFMVAKDLLSNYTILIEREP